MIGSWKRKPAIAAAMIFVLILATTGVFIRSIQIVRDDAGWVSRTNEVVGELNSVVAAVREMEAGAQGHVITGDVDFLTTFQQAEERARKTVDRIAGLVGEDPRQQAGIARLRPMLDEKIEAMREMTAARETAGFEQAKSALSSGRSRRAMDQVVVEIDSMRSEELRLLNERRADAATNYGIALAAALISGIICSAVLLVSGRMINTEFEARIRSEIECDEQRQQLAFTLASIGDAVICCDTSGNVTMLNRAAESLTGWSSTDAVKRPMTEVYRIVDEATRTPIVNPALRALKESCPVDSSNRTILITKDGRDVAVEDRAAPIRARDGEMAGVVLVCRDVTQRRTIERLESEQRTALIENEKRKDAFLATLAHELRNPLAPIANGLELISLQLQDPDALRQTRDVMARQVRHMIRLIDDLLDVSRINRGSLMLRSDSAEVGEIVRSAVDMSRPLIDAARHQLALSLSTQPLWVQGDSMRLAQVVTNLLNNAAKFTPPGGTISLTTRREESSAVIRIRDSGIGIPPADVRRVFDMFVQLDPANPRSQGGLGLGLNLAKHIVEKHGGTIAVESEGAGRGTEFTIRLPLGPAPELQRIVETSPGLGASTVAESARPNGAAAGPAAMRDVPHAVRPGGVATAAAPETPDMAPSESYRILLVDDMRAAAEIVARLLGRMGHQVRVAHDGESALAAAREEAFDLVVSDIAMPDMSGYELAGKLRDLPGTDRLVLVALTGYGSESDSHRALEAGFDQHLVKPVGVDHLKQAVALVAKRRSARDGRTNVEPGSKNG
jgi:PAS domain S-box-containing protein